MKPIPFDPSADLAPIPFSRAHLDRAREMKQQGLPWCPHVGCFVWDPEGCIAAESPFPLRVYFILSLPRFLDIFGTPAAVAEKLVWVPTWHQARQAAVRLGIGPEAVAGLWSAPPDPGDELLGLYDLIIASLAEGGGSPSTGSGA
jgi:hypothetical protein